MILLREYGVATDIYFPLVKRGSVDFAASGDYTPAAGDAKISKDGGTAANPTTNATPSAITMGNGAMWKHSLVASDLQCKQLMYTLIDAATKAVEDQMLLIETYGHPDSMHPAIAPLGAKYGAVITGTNTVTAFDTDISGGDDYWNDAFLTFVTGSLAGQTKQITDFADANGRITVKSPGFTAAPSNGDKFYIVNR